MPTLHWIGKEKVVGHHHDVPFKVLQREYEYTAPEGSPGNSTGNRIIHGDNLEALKALLPEFEGRVKCIYIDPPYNTGNEGWVYNDNVNDPRIQKWLQQVVGKEGEDLSRHDKWLCMMYPRLKLLHRLLATAGSIWISIDDIEVANLRLMMDEIFGAGNFVANVLWQKRTSPDARLNLGPAHDFVMVYAKDLQTLKPTLKRLSPSGERIKAYKNPDNDPRGNWASVDITGQLGHATSEQFYEIVTPSGTRMKPPEGRCWAMAERTFIELVKNNRIWFGSNGKSRPRQKKFLAETEGVTAWTWWDNTEVGHNQEGTKELNTVMSITAVFDNPKPTRLINRILQISTDKDSIVLDSFAGSGTTAHAVLKLNAQDGGNRRFILTEMMDYAETITAERVRRVMSGYGEENKAVPGLGGSFEYYTVGAALFDEDGNLNETVPVQKIREYLAYTEGVEHCQAAVSPYVFGRSDDALYLFYYEPGVATTLDYNFLSNLEFEDEKRPALVVYADNCLLSQEQLRKYNIIFKKIPRDVTIL